MKMLGRGWQYTVYDLGNRRVLKKYNTWFDAYMVMLKDSFFHVRPPVFYFSRYYSDGQKSAISSLKKVSETSLDAWVVGNPKVLSGCEYEQDFVEPLSEYFERVTVEDGKRMIDRFVEFTLLLLRSSVLEKNCNIADNFGLNDEGKIILIDLGEICFVEEEIQDQIQKRVWAAPDVLSRLPIGLRSYFVEEMDRVLGESSLQTVKNKG